MLIACVLLAGCSSTQRAYQQNIRLYFDSDIDVTLSDEEARSALADLIYVKSGERPMATMALAFIENGRYKWVSKDSAMLITESGRIVRTTGFEKDLLYISNLESDVLKSPLSVGSNSSWNAVVDSEANNFGSALTTSYKADKNTTLTINGHVFPTILISEKVNYQNSSIGEAEWTNSYWYHKDSMSLIGSIQTSSNSLETFEIYYLSRALRLVEDNK